MRTGLAEDQFDWRGPAARLRRLSLLRLFGELFIPPKGHRVVPTSSGMMLIIIGLCLGLAAYNTENNILFAALSLLLSTIILSGIVCWSNFQSARWRLESSSIFRVGETGDISIVVENAKRRFPMFCIQFDIDCLQNATERTLYLKDGLEPGESTRLLWKFQPKKRCREIIRIRDAVSVFPFGFLRKHIAGECENEIKIWPARIPYQEFRASGGGFSYQGLSTKLKGATGELVGLRNYVKGDAPRSIHWKVSAKQGRLVVKQNAAESQSLYSILVDTSSYLWQNEASFERMCSFVATLAEDLFLSGKLDSCGVAGGTSIKVNRVADLETFFDELAVIEPVDAAASTSELNSKNTIVFSPLDGGAVGAFINGFKVAQA